MGIHFFFFIAVVVSRHRVTALGRILILPTRYIEHDKGLSYLVILRISSSCHRNSLCLLLLSFFHFTGVELSAMELSKVMQVITRRRWKSGLVISNVLTTNVVQELSGGLYVKFHAEYQDSTFGVVATSRVLIITFKPVEKEFDLELVSFSEDLQETIERSWNIPSYTEKAFISSMLSGRQKEERNTRVADKLPTSFASGACRAFFFRTPQGSSLPFVIISKLPKKTSQNMASMLNLLNKLDTCVICGGSECSCLKGTVNNII